METQNETKEINLIDCLKIKHDVNGNPRYVIHWSTIPNAKTYEKALKIARKIGSKKFHNRQYGGGIVFQAYSENEVRNLVKSLVEA